MNRLMLILLGMVLGFHSAQGGEYADAFLLASQHPQAQSLGYSSVGVKLTAGHAMNNPAGFASGVRKPQAGLMVQQFSGLSMNLVGEGSVPVGNSYWLGASLFHSAVEGLHFRPNLYGLSPEARRDSVLSGSGGPGDVIPYREDALVLTLAREYRFEIDMGWKFFKIPVRMPLGISGKYLDKLLVENRGLGFGIDLGAQFFMDLSDVSEVFTNTEWGFGLFLSDILNTPVYWTTEHQDAIKRSWVRGFSIAQDFPSLNSTLVFSSSRQDRYPDVRQYGLELMVKELIFIRGGYDGYTPSLGLGIGLKKVIIDYSFSQHELANWQKIGLNYHF